MSEPRGIVRAIAARARRIAAPMAPREPGSPSVSVFVCLERPRERYLPAATVAAETAVKSPANGHHLCATTTNQSVSLIDLGVVPTEREQNGADEVMIRRRGQHWTSYRDSGERAGAP